MTWRGEDIQEDTLEADLKITVENPVWAKVSPEDRKVLSKGLSYTATFMRPKAIKNAEGKIVRTIRQPEDYQKSVIDKEGRFPAGLVPRAVDWCGEHGISTEILWKYERPSCNLSEPYIKGIKFRDDQYRMIVTAVNEGRGYLKAPPRSGKTVVAAGIISCFPENERALFLVHTITLVNQTVTDFERFFNEPIGRMGGGKNSTTGRIMVATMQSFLIAVEKDKDIAIRWGIVIIDEAHHVSSPDGTYAKILSLIVAHTRIGLTATPPEDKTEARLSLEGFLGPMIGELTMEEGLSLNILSKPRMKFLKIDVDRKIHALRKYEDVYQEGIVSHRGRNMLIIEEAKTQTSRGITVLIVVVRLDHAQELYAMGRAMGLQSVIVNGSVKGDVREDLRLALDRKEIHCVICTAVFREGVNIPSLGCLINAAGGMAEIMTVQTLSRCLTKVEGKDEGILVDILDNSHPYLSSHTIERLCIYSEQGWL